MSAVQVIRGVTWNWEVGEVSYPGVKPVQLTRQQADILEILWRRHPGPASKDVILSQLYGRAAEPEAADAIVKVQAGHIRRKFQSAGLPVKVEGVRSVGYILRFADGDVANGNICAPEIRLGASMLLSELFEAMDDVEDPQRLHAIFAKAIGGLGIDWTGYHLPVAPELFQREARFISNVPGVWQRQYIEQGYGAHDPLLMFSKVTSRPFVWTSDAGRYREVMAGTPMAPRTAEVIEAAKKHGIHGGVSVPIVESTGSRGVVNFFIRDDNELAIRLLQRNTPLLTLLAHYFHGKASVALARDCAEEVGTLPAVVPFDESPASPLHRLATSCAEPIREEECAFMCRPALGNFLQFEVESGLWRGRTYEVQQVQ